MGIDDRHVDVAVALPVYGTFTYRVPETLAYSVTVGHRVLVPFGKRRVTGYVVGEGEATASENIKDILDAPDGEALFPPDMVEFFQWIANYYIHPMGQVIQTALPGGLEMADKTVFSLTAQGRKAHSTGTLSQIHNDIASALGEKQRSFAALRSAVKTPFSDDIVNGMVRQGLVERNILLKKDSVLPKKERTVILERKPQPGERVSEVRKRLLTLLEENGEMGISDLKSFVPTAPRLISSMAETGLVRISQRRVYRDPLGTPIESDSPPTLTDEQQEVVARVLGHLDKGFAAFLLDGVTGSGKTEVYLRLAERVLEKNRSVLILVPEIALISQMVGRFRARFGDRIAVFHSGLSAGERYDQWIRIARGHVSIAIGARSALFAPFRRLGLIVVDEEHDGSYKQESGLRYNARDLAVLRGRIAGALTLLGSATPSVQSLFNVENEKFIRLALSRRVAERSLPEITVVDLREFRDVRGPFKFFTPPLLQSLRDTLNKGQQALLFLNRRGFANFPVCGTCGQSVRCKNCDISLTFHQRFHAYKCHYCGFAKAATSACQGCGSTDIKLLGLGTEKIESQIRELFPQARVARMDQDTTSRKGAIIRMLRDLRNRELDILIGTQMVAKGHDFPNITLVGIICADLSLNFPDFRAGERTFQLLAQVAGRAGRGEHPGRVVLQTYNPDHFSIEAARMQDSGSFYQKEIDFRKALGYPPFSRMAQFNISGKDPAKTREHAADIGHQCSKLASQRTSETGTIQILGPIEAPLSRIAGRHRWQLLIKTDANMGIQKFIRRLMAAFPAAFNSRFVSVNIDVDPYMVM